MKVMSTSTADGINNQELRFTGTIRNIRFGAAYDWANQILVDDKLVSFDDSPTRGKKPELPWGRLVGFDFPNSIKPNSIKNNDFSGYNGRQVEVYCAVIWASGPNMEKVPIYTL